MPFGRYVVYVDESGDHNLATINPQSPVFVLAFCIFDKEDYRLGAVPMVQKLKFDFWGHDCAIEGSSVPDWTVLWDLSGVNDE